MREDQNSIFTDVFTELIRYQQDRYADIREFILDSHDVTTVMIEGEHVESETDAMELIEAFEADFADPYVHDEWIITYTYTTEIWHFSRGLQVHDIETACTGSIRKVKSKLRTEITNLTPRAFERLLFEIFCEVFPNNSPIIQPETHDGGFEMRLFISDPVTDTISTVLVQAKHQSKGVSVAQLRELIGTLDVQSNQHRDKNFRGLMVSIHPATQPARDAARVSNERIDFLAVDDLVELMIKYEIGWQPTSLTYSRIHPTFWKGVNAHDE